MPRTFRILKTLGRGAFGEVHLTEICSEDDFVQTLAVKWLHEEHSRDPEIAGRLRDEARLLGLLAHPNIVRVQGLTRLDGRLAVLMEAVEGVDLSGRTLPPRAAAEVIEAAADALEAAWETVPPGRDAPLRVVHRDIKPSNLMVTTRGAVKVMDFGVARATFDAREVQTRSQQYGTARYMAPERWLDGIAEGPSDIFSLGVTLLELVTGEAMARARLSRQGFEEDIEQGLEPLRQKTPSLVPLVERMLAYTPADRPTALQVRETLGSLSLPGDDLRTWAAGQRPATGQASPLTGTVLTEQSDTAHTLPVTIATASAPHPTAEPTVDLGPPQEPVAPTAALPVVPPPSRRPWLLLLPLVALGAWTLWPSGVQPNEDAPPTGPERPTVEAVPPPPAPSEVQAPAPTPPPEVDAEGRAEPEAAPRAEPVIEAPPAPLVETKPGPDLPPEPVPAPLPRPVEQASPEVVPISFVVPTGVRASLPQGPLREGRQARMLPIDTLVRLEGESPTGPFACTLSVGSSPATWTVGPDGSCSKR